MSKIYHYFTNTDGVGGWWKRILSIVIVPMLFTVAFLSIVLASIGYAPFIIIYWIISGKVISLLNAINNVLSPIDVWVDPIVFGIK